MARMRRRKLRNRGAVRPDIVPVPAGLEGPGPPSAGAFGRWGDPLPTLVSGTRHSKLTSDASDFPQLAFTRRTPDGVGETAPVRFRDAKGSSEGAEPPSGCCWKL